MLFLTDLLRSVKLSFLMGADCAILWGFKALWGSWRGWSAIKARGLWRENQTAGRALHWTTDERCAFWSIAGTKGRKGRERDKRKEAHIYKRALPRRYEEHGRWHDTDRGAEG